MPIKMQWPWRRVEEYRTPSRTSLTAEKGRGLFGLAEQKPSSNLKDYYDYYESENADPSVVAAVDSLADAAVGRGFDLEPHKKKREENVSEKALDAVDLCNDFNEAKNMDELDGNIARNVLVAGFLPVETQMTSVVERCGLWIIDPVSVAKPVWDETGSRMTSIVQSLNMSDKTIGVDRLAWFTFNRLRNNPFGLSIIRPVATLLTYRDQAIVQMNKILKRYASPKITWADPGSEGAIKKQVTTLGDGEDIFFENVPPDFDINKVFKAIEVDPRVRFWEYIGYIDQLIFVGLYAPSLFYFKDATEASARVLYEIVERREYTLARGIKRVKEARWYKPLCELNDLGDYVPHVTWRQKPPLKDAQLPELIKVGIEMGYIDRDTYFEILKNINVTAERPDKQSSGPVRPVARRQPWPEAEGDA